jgi:hypothetical protein
MEETQTFYYFAERRDSFIGTPCSLVDKCLDAMEEDLLSVVATQSGYYLWEYFTLTTDQLVRMCALLQRNRFPSSLLWRLRTRVHWTRGYALAKPNLVSQCPDAIAALSRIEFLWQDLDAVQACIQTPAPWWHDLEVEWVAAELGRQRWFAGLRRAWLLAVVTDNYF